MIVIIPPPGGAAQAEATGGELLGPQVRERVDGQRVRVALDGLVIA